MRRRGVFEKQNSNKEAQFYVYFPYVICIGFLYVSLGRTFFPGSESGWGGAVTFFGQPMGRPMVHSMGLHGISHRQIQFYGIPCDFSWDGIDPMGCIPGWDDNAPVGSHGITIAQWKSHVNLHEAWHISQCTYRAEKTSHEKSREGSHGIFHRISHGMRLVPCDPMVSQLSRGNPRIPPMWVSTEHGTLSRWASH